MQYTKNITIQYYFIHLHLSYCRSSTTCLRYFTMSNMSSSVISTPVDLVLLANLLSAKTMSNGAQFTVVTNTSTLVPPGAPFSIALTRNIAMADISQFADALKTAFLQSNPGRT